MQAAADLYAKITAKEIEIAVLENYVSSSHNGLIRAKIELNELEAKFSQMKSSDVEEIAEKNGQNNINLFVPLNELPEIAVSYFRLYREVTLQEKLLEFLLPQYEQMKIQEAKDTPTVQVLDYAVPPIKRSSPKRTVMVLFSGFLSFLVSFFLIYIFEYWQRVKDQGGEEYKKLSSAFSLLKPDKKT